MTNLKKSFVISQVVYYLILTFILLDPLWPLLIDQSNVYDRFTLLLTWFFTTVLVVFGYMAVKEESGK